MSCFEALSENDIEYWARFRRWTVFNAIFLSMGRSPRAQKKDVPDPEAANAFSKEFVDRLEAIKQAIADGELVPEQTPADSAIGYVEDSEVDTKKFLLWAERKFENTCPELSQKVLASYKSTPHSSAGKQKGKKVDAVKKRIQVEAERQLDAGCKCQHSELAEYLKHMRRGDGSYAFPIPENRNKPSIKDARWLDHVLEATTAAFRAKNIPLRNESKTEPRGRALCEAHRDWTIPPASQ